MTLFKKSLAVLALSFMAHAVATATPVVKEYQTIGWSAADGVQKTVAAVGGLSYGGQVAGVASLPGTDIVIGGVWNPAFAGWVAAGGIYIWHDWYSVANQLPGLGGATFVGFDYADIDVIDAASPIVNGPFGVINDSLLDGGSASTHGAWSASSLVSTDALAGAVHAILSSTDDSAVVMFEMSYGLGRILYANIPLEAYTDSSPLVTGPQPAGLRVYAGNELAYAKALLDGVNNVPEPGSALLVLLALGGAVLARRQARV